MTVILDAITEFVTAAVGWMSQYIGVITETTSEGALVNPILLLFTIVPLVGLGVGLMKRLMHI